MKQTDPQYKLRIPPGLKEQIEAASKASGRSMNAEIVARLEASFDVQSGSQNFQRDMELLTLQLTSRAEMLGMRASLAMLKKDHLAVRLEAALAEEQRLAEKPLATDADFERAEGLIETMKNIEGQAAAAEHELTAIVHERDEVVGLLDALKSKLSGHADDLERRMAEYRAKKPPLK